MVERDRPSRPRPKRWAGSKYETKRKSCSFCASKVESIDYKDSARLRSFISDRGKMEPRRRTGTCARHQRALALAIKRARHLALLPYIPAHIAKTGFSAVTAPAPVEQAKT